MYHSLGTGARFALQSMQFPTKNFRLMLDSGVVEGLSPVGAGKSPLI